MSPRWRPRQRRTDAGGLGVPDMARCARRCPRVGRSAGPPLRARRRLPRARRRSRRRTGRSSPARIPRGPVPSRQPGSGAARCWPRPARAAAGDATARRRLAACPPARSASPFASSPPGRCRRSRRADRPLFVAGGQRVIDRFADQIGARRTTPRPRGAAARRAPARHGRVGAAGSRGTAGGSGTTARRSGAGTGRVPRPARASPARPAHRTAPTPDHRRSVR